MKFRLCEDNSLKTQDNSRLTPEAKPYSFPLAYHLINMFWALLFGIFVYMTTKSALSEELSWNTFLQLSLAVRNSSLTLLFLIRRPPITSSRQIGEWILAFTGTFIGFLYTTQGAYPLFPPHAHGPIYVLLVFAVVLSIVAILSLGRSFGNRGIQTKGLYAFVRHPIYACYLVFDTIFISIRFSWTNLTIYCFFVLTQYFRAILEERLLRRDPVYCEYARKTRYMLIPGLF
jgi:protein-S-isoprenylcysteine O-methyltransferase Ste14